MSLVLPKSTVDLIAKVTNGHRHPSLQLDKFSVPGDQQAQKTALDQICKTRGDAALLASLSARRAQSLGALPGYHAFCCTTTGPLTLHLSRPSALENAGICLSPLYGFAYLPGSGLKGMARAYAETVWLPVQEKQRAAWRIIEDIFGWAPNPQRKQQIRNKDHPATARRQNDSNARSPEIGASVGNVVFHDAWPVAWPKLIVDIVNSHHPDYYQNDDDAHPPGDWENPVPVYFLAVKPGTTFTFALSKHRAGVPDDLLELARQWLLGALCHLGAGAKTNAGYGAFKPADDIDEALLKAAAGTWDRATAVAAESSQRVVFETTLELVTPAFLAGANQQREDCDLRPATLRGQLRWWWRTMYAGYVSVAKLRALEAAIWGDTKHSSAVSIAIRKINGTAIRCPFKGNDSMLDDSFQRQHGLVHAGKRKTTQSQGLFYFSYGMDEGKGNDRKPRFCIEHGAKWTLHLAARKTQYNGNSKCPDVDATRVLNQAKAALWLLCHLGGVGAKCRKGFGSFADMQELSGFTLEHCRQLAADFRRALGLDGMSPHGDVQSAALPTPSDRDPWFIQIDTQWKDPWFAIDQIGAAARDFAQASTDSGHGKHCPAKKALGLPRKIHGPRPDGPLEGQEDWKKPKKLEASKGDRHASPVLYHVGREHDGKLVIRVSAFPSSVLPNLDDSRRILRELLGHLQQQLAFEAKQHATKGQNTAASSPTRPLRQPDAGLPQSHDRVQAVLVENPKGKERRWAKLKDADLNGPILGPDPQVLADKRVGDELELIVSSISTDGRQIAFDVPTPDDDKAGTKKAGRSVPKSKRGRH